MRGNHQNKAQSLPVIDHLDIWTSAWEKKASGGRGGNGKLSPYGIQKLRELILELAVRGRLVPQDPSDEPASVLLEKIAEEKARLVREGKIKKPRKLPEITEDEKPFELPDGWEWVRVRDICHEWGQKKPDKEFTYIDVSAIDNKSGLVVGPSVVAAKAAPSRARKIVRKGTVIYSTVRPYLKNIAVISEEFDPEPIASTAFAIVHPFSGICGKFLVSLFRSPYFVRYVESVQTGIAYPAINDKQFFGAVIPLPPLAEQRRIVTKVDELMALCDRLEQEQTDSLQAHQTLVETLLRTLTDAPDAQTAQQAWQRIAQHFDLLFITETAIDQLKQTILQLAVMGKLVPQDPNDEPAGVLLDKIAEEKARLVKEGKIKKPKDLPEITEEEIPYNIPDSWAWQRLASVFYPISVSKNKIKTSEIEKSGDFPVIDQGQSFIAGYTSKDDRVIKVPGPVIVFGDHTTALKYINFDFVAGADGVKILRPIVIYEKYFYLVAQILPIENRGYGRHYSRLLDNLFPVPPLAEQYRIVAKVDELMALCDALKARIQEAETTQLHLADAVVEQAVGQ